MKLRLSILLLAAALAASPAAGQTIKSLGYNTTNGQVVYSGTNTLTFTNPLAFGDTTNTASIRTNLGLGATNYPVFRGLEITDGDTLYINPYNINADTFGLVLNFEERNFSQDGATVFEWNTNSFTVTPNATLNGVDNLAPSQTADSGSSLMTRDLVDAAYTRTFNKYAVYESYNFTTSMLTTIGGSASPIITTGGADTPAWVYRPNSTSDGANNYQALLGPYATLSTGVRSQKNWSKKTTLAFRIMHISSGGTSRYYYGPVASSWAGGDLAVKGIGFEIVANSIFAVCHNGTTKTTSASGVALTNQHLYNIVSESDGTGNVRWWVNGAEQTALTNGPSGVSASSAYGFVTEAVNPTPASATFIVVQGLQLISEL
jgi:hypothetical protein